MLTPEIATLLLYAGLLILALIAILSDSDKKS